MTEDKDLEGLQMLSSVICSLDGDDAVSKGWLENIFRALVFVASFCLQIVSKNHLTRRYGLLCISVIYNFFLF